MSTTVALQDLLRPSVVLGTISRTRYQYLTVSEMLGLVPRDVIGDDAANDVSLTTANMETLPARVGTYDVFNRPLNGVNIVGVGAPAQIIAPQAVGNVQYRVARIHPSLILYYDKMSNNRVIGQNAAAIDREGQAYITKQSQYLGLVTLNTLEIMVLGMISDSLYLKPSGAPDSYIPRLDNTGAVAQLKYQIPTTNISSAVPGLQMGTGSNIIDAAWSSTSTTILTHLNKIDAAFVSLTGRPLRRVVVNGIVWTYIINNTEIRTAAGTAATPWASFDYTDPPMADGEVRAVRKAVLKAMPGVEFVINNENITVDGTQQYKFGSTKAAFFTDMEGDIVKLGGYVEPIVEQPGQTPINKGPGMTVWHEYKANPSGVQLFSLLNVVPMLLVPSCIANATIA